MTTWARATIVVAVLLVILTPLTASETSVLWRHPIPGTLIVAAYWVVATPLVVLYGPNGRSGICPAVVLAALAIAGWRYAVEERAHCHPWSAALAQPNPQHLAAARISLVFAYICFAGLTVLAARMIWSW